ncbi:MAG TPA: phage holin family protein [Bradyrhizobium sp.]|uniref:phage holin family protein n=1 Tax=Bradyrhizobium sp. TaxID=376 RepID=UPI002D7E6183|nr:phage holin family protein [Bradyrhizobium sp.]HET7888919.1 phage holin family protein [Bradyrhizobium sp.]
MNAFARARRRGISALLGSYAADLKTWAVKLAAGYGIAVALMAGGVLAVFGAIAVGFASLFHVLEPRYGAGLAFAILGGGLLVLAVILLLAGWLMMKRQTPPLPKPREQFRAARQMMVGSTISRAVAGLRENDAARPDLTTQILIGAAAVVAAGWIVVSRFGSGASGRGARR